MKSLAFPYQFLLHATINQKRLIILICVILPVFVDAAYGFTTMLGMAVPFGVIYRGAIWFYGVILILLDFYNRKSVHWLFLILMIYPLFMLIWALQYGEGFSLNIELIYAFKITYGFILFHIFHHFKLLPADILKGLVIHAILIGAFFLFSIVTGIGLDTYGEYAFGISSFFSAGYEIGILLLGILGFHIFLNPLQLRRRNRVVISILLSVSLFSIGSTTSVFGTLFILMLYSFLRLTQLRTYYVISYFIKGITITITLILVCLSLIFIVRFIQENHYLRNKYETFLKEGPRSELRKMASKTLNQEKFSEKLIGHGVSTFYYRFGADLAARIGHQYNKDKYRSVEMDFFDILGRSYLLGGLFLLIYGYFYWTILNHTIKYKTTENKTYLLVFSLLLFHSMIAGHVLFTPTVLQLVAYILYKTDLQNQKHIPSNILS